jgi:hypothetical protein
MNRGETTRRVHLIHDEKGVTLARVALIHSLEWNWIVEIRQYDRFDTREVFDTEREARAAWRAAAQAVTNFY